MAGRGGDVSSDEDDTLHLHASEEQLVLMALASIDGEAVSAGGDPVGVGDGPTGADERGRSPSVSIRGRLRWPDVVPDLGLGDPLGMRTSDETTGPAPDLIGETRDAPGKCARNRHVWPVDQGGPYDCFTDPTRKLPQFPRRGARGARRRTVPRADRSAGRGITVGEGPVHPYEPVRASRGSVEKSVRPKEPRRVSFKEPRRSSSAKPGVLRASVEAPAIGKIEPRVSPKGSVGQSVQPGAPGGASLGKEGVVGASVEPPAFGKVEPRVSPKDSEVQGGAPVAAVGDASTAKTPSGGREAPDSDRRRGCIIESCSDTTSYLKAHAWEVHLPGVFSRSARGGELAVGRQRLEALKQIAMALEVREGSLSGLLDWLNHRRPRLLENAPCLQGDDERLATSFARYLGQGKPFVGFRLCPVNSVGCLMSWRVLLFLLSHMTPVGRGMLRVTFGEKCAEGVPDPEEVYDAHCHLDRLWAASRVDGWTVEVVTRGIRGASQRLVGICTSYCDPETWPSWDALTALHPNVDVAVGFHPKKVGQFSEEKCRELESLLSHPRVKALGEVGVDHSKGLETAAAQTHVLRRVLPLVGSKQAVVFHARGMKEDVGAEAASKLLLVVARSILSKDQRIYLHCYTGGRNLVDEWVEAFPNVYFGVSRAMDRFSEHQLEGLRRIPAEQLCLETDAPHLAWPGEAFSTPGQVAKVAELVAGVRGWDRAEVLSTTTRNAQRLFGER